MQDFSLVYIYYCVAQSILQIIRYDFILHLGKKKNRCPYKGQFNQGKITISQEFAVTQFAVTVTHGQPAKVEANRLNFAVLICDFLKSAFKSYRVFAPNIALMKESKIILFHWLEANIFSLKVSIFNTKSKGRSHVKNIYNVLFRML